MSGSRPPVTRTRIDLSNVKETSWFVVAAVVVVASVYPVLVWSNREPVLSLTGPLSDATGGFVSVTLLVYLPLMLVVGAMLYWPGGLRARDLSLCRRDLPTGVAVTVGAWVLMQVVGAAALAQSGAPVRINEGRFAVGVLAAVGPLVGQLFGNALYEEVVFRAFLFTQFRHRVRRRVADAPRWAFALALVASQAIFALIHAPNRIAQGVTVARLPIALLLPFGMGLLLALLYYRTGNLFVAVGLHSFLNTPTMLVGSQSVGISVAAALVVVLAVAWPRVERAVGGTPSSVDEVQRQYGD